MQISVPVIFDSTNQTMRVSESSLITFPQNTSDFSIVTVNGTDCITPTTVSSSVNHYVIFTIDSSVEEVEFDGYFSPVTSSFNLWFELLSDVPTQYALVYYSYWRWWNPDDVPATLSNQHWYTVKIVNNDSIKIYDKDTGTLVHSRSFSGKLHEIRIANFNGSTSYLTNLVLKRTINTEQIRYANTAGIAEIWANIKNWVLAHIGNGTLTIQKNGTDVTTFSANSSSNATANITVPTKVSDLTNDSGFLTTANIPSKTSDLVNDSGFLTSHQSLSNYVTLDSNQTLTSTKSFTTNIDTANTATTSRESWKINFTKDDTNGSGAVQIGTIQFANTGNFCTLMRVANPRSANKPTSGDDVNTGNCWSGIGVSYDFSLNKGYPYAYGCSRWADSSNNDAQLASTSWVRRYCETTKGFLTSHQSLSNYLTKTTNVSEMGRYIDMHYDNATSTYDYDVRLYVSAQGTAAGKGTFAVTAAATVLNHKLTLLDFIYNKNSTLVKGTAPTSTLYTGMYLCDKNGIAYKNNALGLLENSVDKNNLVSTYIRAIKNEANSQVACEIAARVDASGNAYTYAPTPATADNSTKIATTAFVKAQGYLTSHQSLSNYSTLANTVKSLSISGKTITVTPGSGNAYTLTTQDTVYTHPTTAGNKHIPSGGSSGQILKYSSSGTAVWSDVSFTRKFNQVFNTSTSSTSTSVLPHNDTVSLTASQLAVVTMDVTTDNTLLIKVTANNIFVIAIHTLVGTNAFKQDSVNYGSILQQTSTGRSRLVALILPYNSSVTFTTAIQSGAGANNKLKSFSLAVYQ